MPANTQMSVIQQRQKNIEIIRASLNFPKEYKSTVTEKALFKQEKQKLIDPLPKKIAKLQKEISLLTVKDEKAVDILRGEIQSLDTKKTEVARKLRLATEERRRSSASVQDVLKREEQSIEKNITQIQLQQQRTQQAIADKTTPKFVLSLQTLKEIYQREEDTQMAEKSDAPFLPVLKGILEKSQTENASIVELTSSDFESVSRLLLAQKRVIQDKIEIESKKSKPAEINTEVLSDAEKQHNEELEEINRELVEKNLTLPKLPAVKLKEELQSCIKDLKEFNTNKKNNKVTKFVEFRLRKIKAKEQLHEDVKKNVINKIQTGISLQSSKSSSDILASMIEYCIAQLEQADDAVQTSLSKKCDKQGWKVEGGKKQGKIKDLICIIDGNRISMSQVFELTYYAYLFEACKLPLNTIPTALKQESAAYQKDLISTPKQESAADQKPLISTSEPSKPPKPPRNREYEVHFLFPSVNKLATAAVVGEITDPNGITNEMWKTIKQKVQSIAKQQSDTFVELGHQVKIITANGQATIDITKKDAAVSISSRSTNVEIAVLVSQYKMIATVLEKKECYIGASPSPGHTAKLILALQASPDPRIIPIIDSRLEAALKERAAQSSPDSEIQRAFALYEQLKCQREEQAAPSKVATTRKPI